VVRQASAVEFGDFVADAEPRLARAFGAAYGIERGQEALAEAVAYAWEHFEELAIMDNAVGYLFRVGQSRTRPRKRPVVYPAAAFGGAPAVEPRLPDALSALTDRQRVCVVLVHAYDWTQQEVADLLGIAPTSVQNHLDRGLAHLRRAIGSDDDD
jgi:DNA-directed RNA polymerase specialized sigma24 family protein